LGETVIGWLCILAAMDTVYRFAGVSFDARSGMLSSGDRSVRLRPRTADVLEHLLRNAGDIVTKEEFLRVVWADLVVTENSLSQCVMEIRRELGDHEEKVLRTVRGRGYFLGAAVEREAVAPPELPRRPMSFMVLPLVNLSGDRSQDYFAEGLTADLTLDLGRLPGSFVIERGTALSYAERRADARRIGLELGVSYVVEGSVRHDAREVVVNLSVSETREARQVWAERLVAARENLLSLQRSMAGRVAHMLHMDLTNVEADHLARACPTSMDAHDLAMRALSIKVRAMPDVSEESNELVRRAVELDPACAFAWAVLADSRLVALATRNTRNWHSDVAEAEAAARRALAISPEHRTANTSLGAALAFQGRFEEALGYLDRQMALNPNHATAHNWTGIVHTLMGNSQLAVAPHQAAIELSPRDPRLSTWIRGVALAWLHQGEDARGLVEAERAVNVPKPWPRSYETLAMAYAVNRLREEARAAARVVMRHWPGYSIEQHRAEMISSRPEFLLQRDRLLEALCEAGVPERSVS
jgi:TolB-like protein/Flp pilus assembly protein TadD